MLSFGKLVGGLSLKYHIFAKRCIKLANFIKVDYKIFVRYILYRNIKEKLNADCIYLRSEKQSV